jgi:uncharacterized membrane protein
MIDDLISNEARERIERAIQDAERLTSAEIRVHLEDHCPELALDRAAFIFEKLEMHKTELRNGVLIYVAMNDKKAAILGDAGINARVEHGFWDATMAEIITHFKNQQFDEGIVAAVMRAGGALRQHFPIAEGDRNELSNTVTSLKRKRREERP